MPRVVSNNDSGTPGHALTLPPFLDIAHQSLRRTGNVEIVHRIRSNAGELRSAQVRRNTAFRFGNDLANGAPSQSASAKSERLVEAVVQFRPFAFFGQFINDS